MEAISEYKVVTARKLHKCDLCGEIIFPGEKYGTQTLKHNYLYHWKNHLKCEELVIALDMDNECDEGVTHEAFYEIISEKFKEISNDEDVNFRDKADAVYLKYVESKKFGTDIKEL
jgi:hypothetical protein